jgi:hypothetical protein
MFKVHCKVIRREDGVITSMDVDETVELGKEDILDLHSAQAPNDLFREDISEYVAQLQLHMALQARNLVPSLTKAVDSREQLLQQTQATIEKLVSRQAI